MAYPIKYYNGTSWETISQAAVDSSQFYLKNVDLPSNRNKLINGNFSVWQRGSAVKFNAGQGAYGPDRWCGSLQYQNSRTQRTSITSAPAGLLSQYCMRVGSSTTTEASNGTRMRVGQTIESIDCFPLRGKTVTLSFWIRFSSATFSSVTNTTDSNYGNFGYTIWNITSSTDGQSHITGPDSETVATIVNGSLPTTWTKYTLTANINTLANNVSAVFSFSNLGSTAAADTNWYEIAQVQLEVGNSATEFEFEPYETTLRKCQRYFQTYSPPPLKGVVASSTTIVERASFVFPVVMRVKPVPTFSGTVQFWDANANPSVSSIKTDFSTASVAEFDLNMSSAFTATGRMATCYNNASGTLSLNAEL